MRDTLTSQNEFWVFFGHGIDWPSGKCNDCLRMVDENKGPNHHCINCWKLEIFFSNCTDVDAVKDYFLREAEADPALHGKWSKKMVEIPRDLLTSIPAEAHPDPDVIEVGGFLIYCQTIAERERRREKILSDLMDLDLYTKRTISYRRGCLNFDAVIGNWTTWYPIDEDFPDPE